jgi:hypothetical protein
MLHRGGSPPHTDSLRLHWDAFESRCERQRPLVHEETHGPLEPLVRSAQSRVERIDQRGRACVDQEPVRHLVHGIAKPNFGLRVGKAQ